MNKFKLITYWIVPAICTLVVATFYLQSNYELFFKSAGYSLLLVLLLSFAYDRISSGKRGEIEKPFEDL